MSERISESKAVVNRASRDVWKSYRRFRRGILATAKLEEQVGIDLYRVQSLLPGKTVSDFDVWFVVQSFDALTETCAEAADSIRLLKRTIPDDIMDDVSQLEQALTQRIPSLDTDLKGALLNAFRSCQNPRSWVRKVIDLLSLKIDAYRLCSRILRTQMRSLDGATLGVVGDIMSLPHRLHGELTDESRPQEAVGSRDKLKYEWSEKLKNARRRGARAIENGHPCFAANAEYGFLSRQLCATHPDIAADLGVDCCGHSDPEPILCLFFGLGALVCAVAFGLAIASHNVETDPDEDDGGTTGGDDGGTSAGDDADPD